MTIEERLLEEVQVHFEEDEFDEKVIKICIRRAINAFKSKRNYPSSYDDEKINKDLNTGNCPPLFINCQTGS